MPIFCVTLRQEEECRGTGKYWLRLAWNLSLRDESHELNSKGWNGERRKVLCYLLLCNKLYQP